MRFMMFVRSDKNTEAGVLPSKELITAMGRFNEEMMKDGEVIEIRQVFEAADFQ